MTNCKCKLFILHSIYDKFVCNPHYPVPYHQKIEPDEETEHTPTVRHQRLERECLLLSQNLH